MSEALRNALDNAQNNGVDPVNTLRIFTDSQAALKRIQAMDLGPVSYVAEDIREHHRKLEEAGIETHLHWVPGHHGIEVNEIADAVAKEASKQSRHRDARRFGVTSITHVIQKLRETSVEEEEEWAAKSCAIYYPQRFKPPQTRTQKPDPAAMKTRKSLTSKYFRFATDRGLTMEYLKMIRRVDSSSCWWCDAPRQNREHLFKECRNWQRQQEKLWKSLKKIGLTKSHALSTIFAERRATAAILEFLETSDVGMVKNDSELREEEERRAEEWGWEQHEEGEIVGEGEAEAGG